ncbi:putative bifunctional diguanylate cyclase/phosphodiesterase [Micromonosporaceae bacterium Da 78-11]
MSAADLDVPDGDATRRPVGVTTAVGMVLFVLSVGWPVIGLFHVWAHPALGWLPLPVMAGLAAHACRRVTRQAHLAAPTRRFWGQLGLGCGALVLALLSNMYDALGGPTPSQYVSPRTSVLYLGLVVLVMWSLLRLPTWQRTRGDWARFGLDAGIIVLTTGALIWHFSLRRIDLWTAQTGSALPVLAICGVASISMITFIKVELTGAGQLDRRALHILSSGVALAAASGALSPWIIDRPYLSTTLVAGAAASLASQLAAERQLRADGAEAAGRTRRRFSILPYLAAAVMSAMLLSVEAPRGGEELILAICVVTLTALVVIRQITALHDNGRLLATVDTNLSQLRGYQEQLAHQISHDTLTEIANRSLFAEKVTAQLATGGDFQLALIDLDDFKVVNDRLGHGTGDALLKAVSRRLHSVLRPQDTVARLGGDEFTLLLPGLGAHETDAVMRRLLLTVQQPLLVDGQDLVARISVGVTVNQAGDTPEELLRRADVAMYAAKTAGGGRWSWFDPIMDRLADEDARLGHDLRQATARDELFVLYQPIVELPHGELAGVEALVRWRHPEHGLIPPAVFIPLAERNGYIVELGRWVLEQVVRQAAEWELTHGVDAPEKVSVNISARQLHEPDFPAEVAQLLQRSGLKPYRLVAEVTETAVLGTGEALEAVRRLSEMGLRIALDDFGTGQSSLSLLVNCPVKVLKVDKSFVDGVTWNSPQAVIVDGLIGITDGLRIEAVAEGVETLEQAQRLHRVGYRYAQGFHFARPMPGEDIALLLDVAAAKKVDNLH